MLALLVGAILAMAGVALQGLLLNPLADPYTVGVSSGAALGAGIAMILGLAKYAGGYGVPALAFVFAMGAMFIVYALARSAGRVSIHSFLLAGIVVGSFLWAILSFVLALAAGDPAQTQGRIIFWLLGSFDAVSPWPTVRMVFPFAVFGLVALFAFARDLNVFAMGEEPPGPGNRDREPESDHHSRRVAHHGRGGFRERDNRVRRIGDPAHLPQVLRAGSQAPAPDLGVRWGDAHGPCRPCLPRHPPAKRAARGCRDGPARRAVLSISAQGAIAWARTNYRSLSLRKGV